LTPDTRLNKANPRIADFSLTWFPWAAAFSESRVIRPGHWERAQISEMGIVGS